MERSPQITETLLRAQSIRAENRFQFDPLLEPLYQTFHRERHRMPRVLCAAVGSVIILLSPIYEYLLDAPSGYGAKAFFIQSLVMLLPMMCTILIMLTDRGKKHTELGISLIAMFVCLGMFAERRVGAEYGFEIPFAFPCAIIVFSFLSLRLRFFTFLPIATLSVILHSLNEISLNPSLTPTFYNVFFIWIMFGFSAASAFNTERRERENWLNQQLLVVKSNADHLTQLGNKRGFDAHLESVFLTARRHQKPLSLLTIDIDYFKEYNDSYGHQRGDDCLALVANAIGTMARRNNDLAARVGGEEFALILYDTAGDAATELANQLQDDIKALGIPHNRSRVSDQITVSIGGSYCVPGPEFTCELLVTDADSRLYSAKNKGRNRIAIGKLV